MPTTVAYRPIEFSSEGATLRGRLSVPPGHPAGAVVTAQGCSGTIPMILDTYAEAFWRHGPAAMAYGHRDRGSSDGEPRGGVNASVQARGCRDALSFVRESSEPGHPSAASERASEAQPAWLAQNPGAAA